MRIIFSVYDDVKNPYYAGGGAVAIHEIAHRLSKKHDVLIINSRYPKSKSFETDGRVLYRRIGIGMFGPKIDQVLFSLLLPFHVFTEKYDVWIESFLPPLSGSFLPLLTRKPVIGLAYFLNADMMQKKYHLPFTGIENLMLKNYKNVVALSHTLHNKIVSVNKKANVAMIPLGVSREYFTQQYRKNSFPFVLFLGRLDTYNKGLDILFPAMINLLRENPKLSFIVAGTGIDKDIQELKKIVIESGLEERIIFKGKVSEQEKIKLLSECLVYAFPSRYETFGMSMLEALAIGTPSILFDIPGFEWIPTHCVVKVEAFNKNVFFEELKNLISNSTQRKKLSENSKKFAKQFDWNSVERKYEDYINQVFVSN